MPSWEFPAEGPADVHIRIPAGSVAVTAAPTPSICVAVEPADGFGGSDLAGMTRVEYRTGRLDIAAPDDRRLFRRSASLDVRVTVPPGSGCTADTASADVRCAGELGALGVHTASGDVTAEQATGETDVTTASGDVRLDRCARTRVKTVSGDVLIGAAGGDVGAESISGDVQIGPVAAGRVTVTTTSGDITVAVASGTGVRLDLSTLSGDASSELDHGGPEGAADATVTCRSVSGDVTVRRAA